MPRRWVDRLKEWNQLESQIAHFIEIYDNENHNVMKLVNHPIKDPHPKNPTPPHASELKKKINWEIKRTNHPLSINSERLIKQQADRLSEDGYRDAGYEYVSIDVSTKGLFVIYMYA